MRPFLQFTAEHHLSVLRQHCQKEVICLLHIVLLVVKSSCLRNMLHLPKRCFFIRV